MAPLSPFRDGRLREIWAVFRPPVPGLGRADAEPAGTRTKLRQTLPPAVVRFSVWSLAPRASSPLKSCPNVAQQSGCVFVRVFLVSGRRATATTWLIRLWLDRPGGAFQMFLNVCVANKCLGSQTRRAVLLCATKEKKEAVCIDLGHAHAWNCDTMSPVGANARLRGIY